MRTELPLQDTVGSPRPSDHRLPRKYLEYSGCRRGTVEGCWSDLDAGGDFGLWVEEG